MLQSLQSFFQAFRDHSKCSNYNWYHCHIIIIHLTSFMNLNDSKSPQVSRILLSILADLNYAVFWRFLILLPISTSCSPLGTIPSEPITIGITVNLMFYSFLCSLSRSKYLDLFSLSLFFSLSSAGTAKSTIGQVFFFVLFNYHKV